MSTSQTLRNRTNRELRPFNNYFDTIPLSGIFEVVRRNIGEVVQEDGTPWSGLLCGTSGTAIFGIANFRSCLRLDWYKMPSGRYEIVVYVT
jgi:hypothetical protein